MKLKSGFRPVCLSELSWRRLQSSRPMFVSVHGNTGRRFPVPLGRLPKATDWRCDRFTLRTQELIEWKYNGPNWDVPRGGRESNGALRSYRWLVREGGCCDSKVSFIDRVSTILPGGRLPLESSNFRQLLWSAGCWNCVPRKFPFKSWSFP